MNYYYQQDMRMSSSIIFRKLGHEKQQWTESSCNWERNIWHIIACYHGYLPWWYLWRCWKEVREKSILPWFCLPTPAVIQSDPQQMEGYAQLPTIVMYCQARNTYYFCPPSGRLYLWNQRTSQMVKDGEAELNSFICVRSTRSDTVKSSQGLSTWEVQFQFLFPKS